jgi:hypothetical protein
MVATLVRAASDDADPMEECRLRHAAVVNAYVEGRAEVIRYNEALRKAVHHRQIE